MNVRYPFGRISLLMDREQQTTVDSAAGKISAHNSALRLATAFSKGARPQPATRGALVHLRSQWVNCCNCDIVCFFRLKGLWTWVTCPIRCWFTCARFSICGTPLYSRLCRPASPTSQTTSCLRSDYFFNYVSHHCANSHTVLNVHNCLYWS